MQVEFISATPNAEKIILKCARVSSPNPNSRDTGLIKYLIRNKHWSPFEMAHALFKIETSRAVSQQIIRHRSFSFQEFSQRYSPVEGFETAAPRRQAEKNRQSSIDDLSDYVKQWWSETESMMHRLAATKYADALDLGIAKETARFLLPLSSKTTLYMSGSIRSWIHYFELRCDEHTQLEHTQVANAIRNELISVVPTIAEVLKWTKN